MKEEPILISTFRLFCRFFDYPSILETAINQWKTAEKLLGVETILQSVHKLIERRLRQVGVRG